MIQWQFCAIEKTLSTPLQVYFWRSIFLGMDKNHPNRIAKDKRVARAKRYLRLSRRLSLVEIGQMENPPISRQRVHQLISSLKDEE
jgi:hypothetical protein